MSRLPFTTKEIEKIRNRLILKKETISVAESVTAGLLQLALASGEEAMQYFQGGITAYNIGQKARHLLVEPVHAMACNCVSRLVAEQMAQNVCHLFNSQWGVGITGYASPVPESGNKVFSFFAIAYHNRIIASHKLAAKEGTPYEIQVGYVERILAGLSKQLYKHV